MNHRRWTAAAGVFTAGLTVLGLMMPVGVAAATAPAPIDGSLGSRCVGHYGATPGQTFKLVWRSAGGGLVARRDVTVDTDGVWSACVSGHRLSSGDTLKATNASGGHEFTVPLMTIAANRTHDYLSGRGPAGGVLRIHCDFSDGFEPCTWHDGVRVGPNGYWSLRVPFEFGGGTPFDAAWQSDTGDRITAFAQGAFVTPEVGTANVSGALAPKQTRTIFLYSAAMALKGKAVVTGSQTGTTNDGSFRAIFRDSNGDPVVVAPGDNVDASRLASDSMFVIPTITATATASNDRVQGACENTSSAAGYANISLYRTGHLRGYARFQGDGENGVFDFNFRHLTFFDNEANVKPGDRLVIDCVQHHGDGALLTIFAN